MIDSSRERCQGEYRLAERNWSWKLPSREHIPQKWHLEDDFPFPKVGYVNSLEGNTFLLMFTTLFWRDSPPGLWPMIFDISHYLANRKALARRFFLREFWSDGFEKKWGISATLVSFFDDFLVEIPSGRSSSFDCELWILFHSDTEKTNPKYSTTARFWWDSIWMGGWGEIG